MSANLDKQGGLMGWIDDRFPLTKLLEEHVTKYYAPKNFNFWYYFGALSMLVADSLHAFNRCIDVLCRCLFTYVPRFDVWLIHLGDK